MKSSILIVGAGSGIGRSISEILIQRNESIIVAHRDISIWENCDCPKLTAVSCDVLSDDDCKKLMSQLLAQNARIKAFIYTVGSALTMPLNSLKTRDYEEAFNMNTIAFFSLVQKLLQEDLFDENGASVIAISSLVATVGARGKIAYAASKGALEAGVRSLSLELAPKKIRINAIAPGTLHSPMYDNLVKRIGQESVDKIESEYPFGFGFPKDVSGLISMLLDENNAWISGEMLIMDGGYNAR